MSTPKPGHLIVAEHFLSIQGEGQTMGRPSYFLRLANCNLLCGGAGTQKDGKLHNNATWRCDSIEVWMKGRELTFDQIVSEMGGSEFTSKLDLGVHLIITGGEPLMQQLNVIEFIHYLRSISSRPATIEIETNGTIMPLPDLRLLVRYWNVSPKLSNSGMKYKSRVFPALTRLLASMPGTIFKIVVEDEHDLREFMEDYWPNILEELMDVRKAVRKVWLMPAADNSATLERVSQDVAALAIKHGFNFSHRMHIAIWNKKTGV